MNVEEVTLKVSFDLTAAEVALPSPQTPYLSISLSLSLQECIETSSSRDNTRASAKPTMVPVCEYLLQMFSAASLVMLFMDCNAWTTGCDSVARINFIDVNRVR